MSDSFSCVLMDGLLVTGAANTYNPLGNVITFLSTEQIANHVRSRLGLVTDYRDKEPVVVSPSTAAAAARAASHAGK
jgi:hypothetical protein